MGPTALCPVPVALMTDSSLCGLPVPRERGYHVVANDNLRETRKKNTLPPKNVAHLWLAGSADRGVQRYIEISTKTCWAEQSLCVRRSLFSLMLVVVVAQTLGRGWNGARYRSPRAILYLHLRVCGLCGRCLFPPSIKGGSVF